jgi:hypothetical protein
MLLHDIDEEKSLFAILLNAFFVLWKVSSRPAASLYHSIPIPIPFPVPKGKRKGKVMHQLKQELS